MLRLPAPLAAVLVAALALPAVAQDAPLDPGVRPVTRAVALTDARVVQAPGRVLERATVVVRDGLIEAVGPDVAAPPDADVVAADSFTVYAGFLDALGHAGLQTPEADEEAVRNPGDPPRDRAGILPDRDARTLLDPSLPSVGALRNLGFAAAHVVPEKGMLPGQGAVVLLRGEAPEEAVLRPRASLVVQFDEAAGMYPATPMAVLAKLRALYRNAGLQEQALALYDEDPAGLARPTRDPALDALLPSLRGEQPVYFYAEDVLEAHRALAVTEELGLPLVLAGVGESSMLLEKIQRRGVPVLASLDLPEADTSAADSAAVAADPTFLGKRRTLTYADVEDEEEALAARRREAVALYERNAATLAGAGVPFAFATVGAEAGEIRANLRRMVEAGLSRDDALAALTTAPAELLGLGRALGTVEPGKLANLVVTTGDYFADTTAVRYVFVEGERFEVEADAGFDPDAEVEVAGTWDYSVATPDGTQEGTMRIEGSGDALSGTISIPGGPTLDMVALTLTGNRLSFRLPETPFGPLDVEGIITGDTYEAEITGSGLPAPLTLTATRQPE